MSDFMGRYGVFWFVIVVAIAYPFRDVSWVKYMAGIVVLITYPFWRVVRVQYMLSRWASDNGLEIIERKWAWFRLGPFALAFFGGQVVYYLVVRDWQGKRQACWVKLGSFFVGLLNDIVEVQWEQGG